MDRPQQAAGPAAPDNRCAGPQMVPYCGAQIARDQPFLTAKGVITTDLILCLDDEWRERPESLDPAWRVVPFGAFVVAERLRL